MVNKISDAANGSAAAETSASAEASSGGTWMGAGLPKGYGDITGEIDPKGVEILNLDDDSSPARVLFDSSRPSALNESRAAAVKASGEKDWIQSGTDDQLLLFMPFQSMVKLHTVQVRTLPSERALSTRWASAYSAPAHVDTPLIYG